MKINEGKILLLLSGILVGIFLAVNIFNRTLNPTTFLSYRDYENKSVEANKLKIELRGIKREISSLEKKLKIYENGYDTENKTVLETMKKEYEDLKINYGLEKVHGHGLVISIDDNRKKEYIDSFDRMQSTTHNEDLLLVVKDLKNAGAEAISVNEKRIIGTTSITCEGPVIMINGQYIVPPFIIKAIGDSEALSYALTTEPDSHYKDLEIRELKLKLMRKSDVTIEAIDFVTNTKYAESDE
jgi:uncharacterized protein YlxW (UPF0749 family)